MTSHQHPYGKPENVLEFTENDKVFIHDEPLRQMFLHPDVKHRKIVAFSIIGAYRKGKSFFLDYCLRYLYAHYPSINFPNNPVSNPNDWIGDEDEPLSGFSWRSGSIRDTTGLDVWNDVFLYTDEKSGQDIAIFVMDTHGLFDKETSSLDNFRIFTLGTLISSIQVFNLSGVIQEDQLQYLQSATECAKFSIAEYQEETVKCFQNLVLLIRDWENPDEFQYGFKGGEKYLKNFMEVTGRKKKELKYIFDSIYDSYESISCSLLTHPGKFVSRGKKGSQEYDGNWKGMDEDFKDELIILINFLLNPERLALKKINGNLLNGEDFQEFLLNQLKLFQTDELLKAQTLRDSMTEKEMDALVNSCIEYYKELEIKHKITLKTEEDIPALHEQCKNAALDKYDSSKKMGNPDDCTRFRRVLDDKIEQLFKELIAQIENGRKIVENETEKIRLQMENELKMDIEKFEQEKKMNEKRIEAEQQKARDDLENENKLKEQEIKLQVEQKCIAIDKQIEENRIATENEIKSIWKKVEEERQQFEPQKHQSFLKQNEKKLNEDSTVIGHENRANHKTQMLNQTTTDDNVVTPSKVKDNFKRTSIEDNQKRKKYQIKNNFYLSETSKRKEADSYEILPKGHNRDQHQSEKLNNDQVQTINITNCVANDPQENSSTQFSDSIRCLVFDMVIEYVSKKWDQLTQLCNLTGNAIQQDMHDTSKINDLIEKSLNDYKEYIYRDKDTPRSIEFIENLHEMGKKMAIENFLYAYKNIKFMNNDKVYVEDLKSRIEKIYKNSVCLSEEKLSIKEYWEIKEQK